MIERASSQSYYLSASTMAPKLKDNESLTLSHRMVDSII